VTQKRLVVHLFDLVGTALIIKRPSGIWYSNQTGGTSCLQPEFEGVLVPIGNDVALDSGEVLGIEKELLDYFTGPPWRGSGATTGGITPSDADVIDDVLRSNRSFAGISVDRTFLSESHEAWVHVTLEADDTGCSLVALLEGFDPFPRHAILTWSNSD
jgi:hypothetical protein